jgi:hypothetical protein
MSAVEKFHQIADAYWTNFKERSEVLRQWEKAREKGDKRKVKTLDCLYRKLVGRGYESARLLNEATPLALSQIARIPTNMQQQFEREVRGVLWMGWMRGAGRHKDDKVYLNAADKTRAAAESLERLDDFDRNRLYATVARGVERKLRDSFSASVQRIPGFDEFEKTRKLEKEIIETTVQTCVPLLAAELALSTGQNPGRSGRKGAVDDWAFREVVLALRGSVADCGGKLPLDEKDPDGGAKFKAAMDVLRLFPHLPLHFVPKVLPIKSIAADWRRVKAEKPNQKPKIHS